MLAETGSPGGWVQVRENAIAGTKLRLDRDLGARDMRTLRLRAVRTLSDGSALHFGFATTTIDGSTTLAAPAYFNGTTIAPGRIDVATHFQDFLALDASYWRRVFAFDNGASLWASGGLTFDLLNFRVNGTIAADSVGQELKEDFYVQELPVPTVGLHLRYPFAAAWVLAADASVGRLPWVDSLRNEGGDVRLAQTDEDASVGIERRLAAHGRFGAYAFRSSLAQHERSREDGNAIHLTSNGVGLSLGYRF